MAIRDIGYFPLQCAKNSVDPMTAVLTTLKRSGINTIENSWDADAAIIWSVLWHGKMMANQAVYEYYRNKNCPVIVMDVGALVRGKTWKLAVNHLNALGYYGHTENVDKDRPKKLGLSLQTAKENPAILLAAQHRNSLQMASVGGTEKWIVEQVETLRKYTDRTIVVRPHPRSPINPSLLPNGIVLETPKLLHNTYDSFDMSFKYHAIVNHNSGPGTQAAIAGVRPIVDNSSLAWPVSVMPNAIEDKYEIDREKWFVDITHTEYTVEELRESQWLKRIWPAL